MKSLVTHLLTWCSRRVLERHKPIIIAVTGSVGKTSTKEAIAVVLGSQFDVRTAKKNFNTEIGVPLTILGIEKPVTDVGWLFVVLRALYRSYWPNKSYRTYHSHLVLEFGADRPGDISHLCRLAPPSVGVVTPITHVHVSNYPSFEALVAEKTELVKALPNDGLAVLNADEELVTKMKSVSQAPVVTYGFAEKAEIHGEGYELETEPKIRMRFTAHNRLKSEQAEVVLENTMGKHQAADALAALAVGTYFGISLVDGAEALKKYVSPSGRLKPLAGIKGSLLLDDSYNAAPSSTKAALDVLKEMPLGQSGRRIAVLGQMAELGAFTESLHREIGWKAAESHVDLLVCSGEIAQDICRGAMEAGMKEEQIVKVKGPEEAGRYLDHEIHAGDVVLIKGSQGARMEKAVLDVMAQPERANELLVRQEKEWL